MSNPKQLEKENAKLIRQIAKENLQKIELSTERLEKLDIEMEKK